MSSTPITNGKLDSGDQKFSQFKLVVTNANGTQTVETLAQAGVASIDLKENNYSQTFIDGSSIDGQTTFTRTNGTTGTAATVALIYDAAGNALQTTTSTAANGAVTVDNKALNPDGSLASETISVTSADGLSRTLSQDVDGDGVIDLVQSETTIVNADGSKLTTLIDKTGGGVNIDKIVTTTSADGKSITFQRDMDASGTFEQTETLVTAADGSKSNIISIFADNGALITKTSHATSANGLTRTDQVDENGDAVWDTASTDATVNNADGSRTETVTVTNANGSLRAKTTVQTSADGHTKTTQSDLDGNGTTDLTTGQVVTSNADGSYWTTTTDRNNNNSLRDQTKTLLSADNLSKTTYIDVNGDGFFERTSTDVTVVAANGDRTQTTTLLNADGTKRAQTIVVKGADGRSRTIQSDTNGDNVFDSVETIAIAANGSSVDTISTYSPRNSLIDKTVVTTSADGLTRTSQFDADANGTWDTTTTEATVKNANGSSTQTTTVTNANGSLRGKSVVSTSADGLSISTQADLDGDGAYDATTTDVRTVAADNSHVQTVSTNNADGSLRDKTITTVTADRHTTTINVDIDGDSVNDQTETVQLQSNAAVVDTVSNFQADGSLKNTRQSTVSADGLSSEVVYSQMTLHSDLTWQFIWPWGWFPVYNNYTSLDAVRTVTDVTTLNLDGSRTQAFTQYNGAITGAVLEQIVTTTSANGLTISKQWTGWNGATAINQTSSDITTY
ncbi:MAG: beta strand repeat-containing protein [Methylocystis sp.]|uniref:beta strand repeat-containing protein n=1 Tax=Methylocystis sp. TaxID=1911079 RepID=UPI003DA4A1F6